jgi:hypothetical protein
VTDPVERVLAALDLALLNELDGLRARVVELEERVQDLAFDLTEVENDSDRLADRLPEACRTTGPQPDVFGDADRTPAAAVPGRPCGRPMSLIALDLAAGDALVALTANSVWRIERDRYRRGPRSADRAARHPASVDDALDDGRWHPHTGGWWAVDAHGVRLRLLPAGRPAGSFGILTGDIGCVRRGRTPRRPLR